MEAFKRYTIKRASEITGIPRRSLMWLLKRKNVKMNKTKGPGGYQYEVDLQDFPPDMQLAIYNCEGAPPELLPALSPAVALAALEREAAALVPANPFTAFAQNGLRGRRARASRAGSLLPEAPPVPASIKNKDTDGAAAAPQGANGAVLAEPPENRLSKMPQAGRSLPGTGDCRGVFAPGGLPFAPGGLSPGRPPRLLCGIEPARRYSYEDLPEWSPERAISEKTMTDPRVGKILAVIRDVEAMPANWRGGANAWKKHVAIKHGVALQTVYRWLQKYDKRGLAGLEHRKSTRAKPKAWTAEALEFWIGLTLKPEMRKMTLAALYDDCLVIEAHRRGWRIGCPASAVWWYNKRATPELRALRDGGMRALDNLLPPVLRDYSDLAPFEMLVGDQHRFDFWVVDDDNGVVFRPEGYLWQDLRTRIIYGAAFDRRYDAHLCGEALRIGMTIYGCFNAIYTDNGSSELSKYMMGILASLRAHDMEWRLTVETPMDVLDVDGEDVQPVVQPIAPGTHKKAIVKNAKAKLIEKTFDILEEILRSKFRLPGSVKRLTDDIHVQDLDHQEAMKLAAQGKLLLASEFYLTVYQALDWYNREKAHRGVRREWIWRPVPAQATPYDCLLACCADGWRPRMISPEAADMLFLKRINRTVRLGRVTIDGEIYEHDSLLGLPQGQPVECRTRPMEADIALVYLDGQFLCPAHPVEYSSMKDDDLARRKILEKRAKRRAIAEKFRALVKSIPDLRNYSAVPEAERVAAVVGEERRRQEAARANLTRPLSTEELAVEMAKMEALNERLPDGRSAAFAASAIGKPIPPRPGYWLSEVDRHLWCVGCEASGGELSAEDREFVARYEAEMTDAQRERWQFEREYSAL